MDVKKNYAMLQYRFWVINLKTPNNNVSNCCGFNPVRPMPKRSL